MVDGFLRDSAATVGRSAEDILAQVLHVGDGVLAAVVSSMDETTRELTLRLDREIRLRNPGLHYVVRKKFIGYRREGEMSSPMGERSQIFISVVRNNSRLDVVLPVDPSCVASVNNAHDLRGKGHHGVGDVRVSIRNDDDIDTFLNDFHRWLVPRTASDLTAGR